MCVEDRALCYCGLRGVVWVVSVCLSRLDKAYVECGYVAVINGVPVINMMLTGAQLDRPGLPAVLWMSCMI